MTLDDDAEPRPTFPHSKGHPWPPQAKALAVRALTETTNTPDARLLLEQWADWPDGLPADNVLRKWASDHAIALAPRHPAKDAFAEVAREHRLRRMETSRADLAELLIDRLARPAAEVIAERLAEQSEVEARVADARRELEEAAMYLDIARPRLDADGKLEHPGLGLDAIKSAVVMLRQAGQRLDLELSQRIRVRDLVGIVTRGVDDHMTLEGLDHNDESAGDIIVQVVIPEATRPEIVEAFVVPQHQLPERTD